MFNVSAIDLLAIVLVSCIISVALSYHLYAVNHNIAQSIDGFARKGRQLHKLQLKLFLAKLAIGYLIGCILLLIWQ